MSTKEDEDIHVLLHCDGRSDAKSIGCWMLSQMAIVNNGNFMVVQGDGNGVQNWEKVKKDVTS